MVDILKAENKNVELLLPVEVAHEDMPYYMNSTNMLVLASLKEGSLNVIKEAMACNLPIVTTDVGDIKELISGVQGCKIVERDKKAFARGISEILETFQRTEGRRAIEHLSLEHVTNKLINFYHQVVESKDNLKKTTVLMCFFDHSTI